jgi:hypothetical protein
MLDLITLVSAVGLQQAGKGLGEVSRDDKFQDGFPMVGFIPFRSSAILV